MDAETNEEGRRPNFRTAGILNQNGLEWLSGSWKQRRGALRRANNIKKLEFNDEVEELSPDESSEKRQFR